MEQTNRITSWIVLVLGIVVSADVLLTIFKHWHGYDAHSRFVAAALMLFLVVPPAMALRDEDRETSNYEHIHMVTWGYMSLLLAMMLFSR